MLLGKIPQNFVACDFRAAPLGQQKYKRDETKFMHCMSIRAISLLSADLAFLQMVENHHYCSTQVVHVH